MRELDPLEYVLNRMERASESNDPVSNGYGPKRKELLDGIASLRTRLTAAEKVVEAAREILANGYDQGRRITLRAAHRALKEVEG